MHQAWRSAPLSRGKCPCLGMAKSFPCITRAAPGIDRTPQKRLPDPSCASSLVSTRRAILLSAAQQYRGKTPPLLQPHAHPLSPSSTPDSQSFPRHPHYPSSPPFLDSLHKPMDTHARLTC